MVNRTGQNAIQALSVDGVRSTAIAASSGRYKWHPGHYGFYNSYNPTLGQWVSYLDSATTGVRGLSSDFKGVGVLTTWYVLEGARGDYSAGIAYVRSLYEAAKSRGLRFGLYVSDTRFGGTGNVGYLPTYLATESGAGGGWAPTGQTNSDGIIFKRWNAAAMQRLIALSNRYAQEFNDEPFFEWFFTIAETEVGVVTDPTYNQIAYLNQLDLYGQSIKDAWSKTIVSFGPNSGFTNADNWDRYFEDSANNRIARSPPDIRPTDFPPAETNPLAYGNTADAYYFGNAGARINYRGLIASGSRVEDPDYAKYGKPFANAAVYKGVSGFWNAAVTIINDSHIWWFNKDYNYGESRGALAINQVMWSNAALQPDPVYRVRAFLTAGGHPTILVPPSCYPGVDTG